MNTCNHCFITSHLGYFAAAIFSSFLGFSTLYLKMEFIRLFNVCNQELIQKQKNSTLFIKARKNMTLYTTETRHTECIS